VFFWYRLTQVILI